MVAISRLFPTDLWSLPEQSTHRLSQTREFPESSEPTWNFGRLQDGFGGKIYQQEGQDSFKSQIVQDLEVFYIFRNGFAVPIPSSLQPAWIFPNPRPVKTTSIQPKHLCKDVSRYPQERRVRSRFNSSYPSNVKVLFSPKARYENPFSFKPKTRQVRWHTLVVFRACISRCPSISFQGGDVRVDFTFPRRGPSATCTQKEIFFSPRCHLVKGEALADNKMPFFCISYTARPENGLGSPAFRCSEVRHLFLSLATRPGLLLEPVRRRATPRR